MKMAKHDDRKRCLISNRGEIARRILKSARARGYAVAVVSTREDSGAPVRREADEVVEVPSFLDARAIIAGAVRFGADLLHPGYGYLSENADFAKAVEENGISFVGPTADNMRSLGNKEEARKLAQSLGLPVLPGCLSEELKAEDPSRWKKLLDSRGLSAPYLIKAAGGGGGRGMRVVETADELPALVERASREALSAFADGRVFIERFIRAPRHIEAQIMGDGKGNVVFLGERECSLQRRHQKVVEETPSPVVGKALRKELADAAARLASSIKYRNAGTVEFLLDEEGNFFFLEVNTRLQVEHPVTELVYGVDLVDAQFELAEGNTPEFFSRYRGGKFPEPRGWAIEARIIAEDPFKSFAPSPGRIISYSEPAGEGVRVDSGVEKGVAVTTAFDSLLSKCVVWGSDRSEACLRMRRALEDYIILGPTTNITFLHRLVSHEDFENARFDTAWIAAHSAELETSTLDPIVSKLFRNPSFLEEVSRALDGCQADGKDENAARFASSESPFPGAFDIPSFTIEKNNGSLFNLLTRGPDSNETHFHAARASRDEIICHAAGETMRLKDPVAGRKTSMSSRGESGEVRAPMAGKVMEVHATEGGAAEEGQLLFVVESMKMQLEVLSPAKGVVREVKVKQGDILNGPDILAVIEAKE